MLLLTSSKASTARDLIFAANDCATSSATSESSSALVISERMSSRSDAFIRPRERSDENVALNLDES